MPEDDATLQAAKQYVGSRVRTKRKKTVDCSELGAGLLSRKSDEAGDVHVVVKAKKKRKKKKSKRKHE